VKKRDSIRQPFGPLNVAVSAALALTMCAPTNDLVSELRVRFDREGLTLVDWNNEYLELLSFGERMQVYASYPMPVRQVGSFVIAPTGRAIAVSELDDGVVQIRDFSGNVLAESKGRLGNCAEWAVSGQLRDIVICGSYVQHCGDDCSGPRRIGGIVTMTLPTEHVETVRGFSNEVGEMYRCGQMWWSPDGQQLVYEYDKVIYVWDTGRKQSRFLVNGRMPSWSPDGQWIAFRNTDGNLQLITPEGAFGRVLYSGGDVGGGVKWSPDGRYIAFGINQYIPPYENSRLMVLRVADGRMAKVTGYWDREVGGRHMWAYVDFSKTPWMRPGEWHEKQRREREQRESPVQQER